MFRHVITFVLVLCSIPMLAQSTQREPPAEQIKRLESENQQLRETIKRLEARLAANSNVAEDMSRAVKITQTELDRADRSMMDLIVDRTVCKISDNGPNIEVTMNRAKWESLTKSERGEFVLAVAGWYRTKIPPQLQSQMRVSVKADDIFKPLGEYKDGRIKFIN